MNEPRVVIVGGGISGLSTAHYLSRRAPGKKIPVKITILEASDRFGGVLQTLRGKEFYMEAGADTFDGKDPAVLDLCKALEIQEELLPRESTLGRAFISKNKKLWPLGLSFSDPGGVFKGRGLSLGARARLLCEFLIASRKNDSDESIASFIQRRFGKEVLNEWTEPLVRGILMAEPEKLSLREYLPHLQKMERDYGSIAGAILNRKKQISSGNFFTIRGGLDRLVSAIVKDLGNVELKTQTPAAVLARNKTWEIRLQDGHMIPADIVCVALPAPQAAKLLSEVAAPLAGELAKIRYDPIAVVNMVFRPGEIPRDFPQNGFIVPSRDRKWPLASLKVIGGTEDGEWIMLRAFVSGVFQSEVYGKGDELLQREVLRGLAGEWGIQALPSRISVERYPHSLAQYETGHAERVSGIEKMLENYPGLFLAGNGYQGFGITDCVRSAQAVASQIVCGFQRPVVASSYK